jgi:two-component system, cell cycle sensor histidine kinase and response regulator CckA
MTQTAEGAEPAELRDFSAFSAVVVAAGNSNLLQEVHTAMTSEAVEQAEAGNRRAVRDLGRREGSAPVRVLVVDDDPNVRSHVSRMLAAAGYEVAVAADGCKALELSAGMVRVDLLVTDLVMPAMNGDELASRLRAKHRDLKVLYLTGFRERLFANRAELWENEGVLDKPCSMTELLAEIAALLAPPTRPDTTLVR